LDAEILRSVSRSFYLSIRFLPAQLREPIALAYLLARTTDTIADTAQIPGSVRMETLKLVSSGIQGMASHSAVLRRTASFVSLQENASERQLLESLPDYLASLDRIDHADRNVEHARQLQG
jgi:farnesyl-diphosphate farnesyltransferase